MLHPAEYHSTDISELAKALAKTHLEMPNARRTSVNPYFKSTYAGLEEIVASSRPYLAKYGLTVIAHVITGEVVNSKREEYLCTMLLHESGQWLKSIMLINPTKQDIQSTGSYITYLRRYCYAALIGIATAEEDDDGEAAMHDIRQKQEYISTEELIQLENELEGNETLTQTIVQKLNLSDLSTLRKNLFNPTIKRIREIKEAERNRPS